MNLTKSQSKRIKTQKGMCMSDWPIFFPDRVQYEYSSISYEQAFSNNLIPYKSYNETPEGRLNDKF